MTQSIEAESVVHSNPNISGGTPVFRGTRVPVQSLFDYLEGGETIDEFLKQFPSVSKETGTRGAESGARLRSDPCAFCLTKPAACSGGGTEPATRSAA